MLTVGGLFSGIGGWELGLERAGMRVLWHCEADPYARRILDRHWPDVPCYPDVRDLHGTDVEPVDVLAGGFPCQDISVAGKGAGIDGARSGLWSEYARLIRDLRPQYVCVENVAALLTRGLGTVLGDLAALGYDAEWDCLPASAFGAPHRRDRIWLVAYPHGTGSQGQRPEHQLCGHRCEIALGGRGADARTGTMAHTESERFRPRLRSDQPAPQWWRRPSDQGRPYGPWATEPDVGRVAHGVPARVDRLRALGNALVPQISEWIGRRIIEWEAGLNRAA